MKNFLCKVYNNKIFNIAVTVMAVLFLPLLYQCLAQFLLKRSFTMTLEYLWIYKRALLVGTVFIILVMAAVTVFTRRAVIGSAVVGISVFCLATAHFFKLHFRGEALMPSDIFLIKEAAIVTEEMDLFLTREMVLYVIFLEYKKYGTF